MSAIAQPVPATAARPEPKPSGWSHLKTLIPYVMRYKGMSALGLLTLALMGLVGALPQLIIGAITVCLQGSPHALSTLTGASRQILAPLFSFYAPLSRQALGSEQEPRPSEALLQARDLIARVVWIDRR